MAKGTLKEVIESWYYGNDDYTSTPNGSLYHSNGVLYSYGAHFPLAFRVAGGIVINGDRYSATTGKHQSYTFSQVGDNERVEIPLSALTSALGTFRFGSYNLNIHDLMENMELIDFTGDTWIDTNRVNLKGEQIREHVLGACVFRYKDRYFFSGIDETGIGTHRYFLTELVRKVESVSEGLESMKPKQVIEAENEGKEVKRQGEWFFVKHDYDNSIKGEKNYVLKGLDGDTGHHIASEGMQMSEFSQLVKGIIKHENKDHKQCKLYEDPKVKEWYIAYHNVQVQSFNSVGNVD